MKIKKFIRGLISYVPILELILRKKGTGGSIDADYCINTYFNHANHLVEAGMKFPPEKIGEIGPGDSLGIGITAILTGTKEYSAMDSIAHASTEKNIKVLDGIVNNLNSKEVKTKYSNFIKNNFENVTENAESYKKLKTILQQINETSYPMSYKVPWWVSKKINENSLDLILSNAVMEHVLELKSSYESMYKWLKPGGYCSHVIDYKAHELSDNWYKHWQFSDIIWEILMHGRSYPINRMPHSYHKKLLKECGFEIVYEKKFELKTRCDINSINKTIRSKFSESDLSIASGHFIVKKPI